MLELPAAFASMCRYRLTRRAELAHVRWPDLLLAPPRELRNRLGGPARLARALDERTRILATPFGELHLPQGLPSREVYWLVRDVLDERSWHRYESERVRVEQGDLVVDCGAADGFWSLSILDRAGAVHLVEPQPAFAACLRATFPERAEVWEVALGAGDGRAELLADETGLATTARQCAGGSVPLRSLDSLFPDTRVDFVKADLEGAERELMLGARRLLARCAPKVAITVYHEENDWRELLALAREAVPAYRHELSGVTQHGKPVLLRLWR